MITLSELNPKNHPLSLEQETNQRRLHAAISPIRAAWGRLMVVTSGVRSWDEHAAIYAKLKKTPPKGSSHLTGAAVDIADPKGELARYCLDNIKLLQQQGLYIEDPSCTRGWVHFQVTAPKSGNTVFIPFARKAKNA